MVLPPILARPPWTRAKKRSGAALSLVAPPIADDVVWGPSGRTHVPWGSRKDESAELDADVRAEARSRGVSYLRLFDATDDTMLDILTQSPEQLYGSAEGLAYLLSRLGQRAIPYVVRVVKERPFEALPYVLALRSAVVAPIAAEAWHSKKTLKMDGGRWLVRHPEAATRVLFPLAAGKRGRARDAALAALALLEMEEPAAFAAALADYGDDARATWASAREEAPATGDPTKAPPSPPFLNAIVAPVLTTLEPLPPDAVSTLCGILSLAPHPHPPDGLAELVTACTSESLAAFARSLFEEWVKAGAPREHGYAARAAVHLGDTELVLAAADAAESWGSDGGFARAVWIVEALAIRADATALGELDHLSRRARSLSLRHRARAQMEEVARGRGVTADDLADALVPHLDPAVVFGASPTKTDRALVSRLRARMEAAMLDGRVWSRDAFTSFVAHPLLGHLARRLVWMGEDDGVQARALRVAEDATLADVLDQAAPAPARMWVAHPTELGADLPRWRTIMHEYELIEPISQLAREVFGPADAPCGSFAASTPVAANVLAGVARRGWVAGSVEDGGRILFLEKTLRGATATMELAPGLLVGAWSTSEPQLLTVTLSRAARACPVLASEVQRDLHALRA